MSSQRAQLSQIKVQLTQEQQAAFARQLIVANEHYRLSNSDELALETRDQHRLQARILAEEVVCQQPDNAAALNLLGRIALDEGQMSEAGEFMLAAIEQAPANASYYVNLGYVRLAARDYEQSHTLFEKALELQANNAQAYAGIAYSLLRKGDHLGAFLRLRSLMQKSYDNAYCRRALFESVERLWADQYDPQMEADLLTYYSWTDFDGFQLGNLTASLLVHKYDLNNDDAQLDLDTLVQDPLLLAALNRSLLSNRLVEGLLTLVRQSLLTEAVATRNLRDELQPVVSALAVYGARTGYAFAVSYDEQCMLNELQTEIAACLDNKQWQHDDVAAALLNAAMYEPLYAQSYSFQLLRDDLADWPAAMQPVMQAALYGPAQEHLLEFEIAGSRPAELLAATPLVRGAAPKWETLGVHPQADYRQALAKELEGKGIAVPTSDSNLQILVAGCRSGQRAISLARFFQGVEVTAVDANLDNIVYAVGAASRYELNNLNFACLGFTDIELAGQDFDIIECGSTLGSYEQAAVNMRRLASLLKPNGLIRFTLPRRTGRQEIEEARARLQANDIQPTPDNVRTVRQILLEEAAHGQWQEIIASPEFYTLAGTRDMLFATDEPAYNLREIQALLQAAGLEFVGFVDLDPISRQRVRALNPRDLMAWHSLDETHQLFGANYEIYCRRAG